MCEICEKEKYLNLNRQYTDTNIQEIKVRVRLTTNYAYLDIKFCPLCGKELKYKERDYSNILINMPKI